MTKRIVSLFLVVVMAVSALYVTPTPSIAAQVHPDGTIDSVPIVKSVYEFRKYVDNSDAGKNTPLINELLEKGSDTYGGVYTFTAPVTGKLVYLTMERNGYVRGNVYSDAALTIELASNDSKSTRDKVGEVDVKAGEKYYIRQERWNGYNNDHTQYATTYAAVIPSSSNGVTYTSVETNFESTVDVTPTEVKTVDEFKQALAGGSIQTTKDYIRDEVKVYSSDVHKFSVTKSGWMIPHGYVDNGYIDLMIYSDSTLSSLLYCDSYDKDKNEIKDLVWIDPGTYYYRAYRWNGYLADMRTNPLETAIGFIPADAYISVSEPTVSSGSSSVKFTTYTSGKIRVISAEPDPVIIEDKDVWQTQDRANMLTGDTFKTDKNGKYVARFE
ncbi:MAG: hypothetical protein IJS24_00270, partial [Eubacterium sp.]|nr:hypothetical protein [Eubacterium sp.]